MKKREEETAKEAKEVEKKKAEAQIEEKALDAQAKIGLEQVKKEDQGGGSQDETLRAVETRKDCKRRQVQRSQ